MAMVDFTNAKIHVPESYNPTDQAFLGIGGNFLTDANGSSVGSMSATKIKEDPKHFIYEYAGSFTASGTEFYFGLNLAFMRWKMTGISFQAGDTFVFQVPVTLTCL